ncbi:MAG: topoisomerase-4 subunit A, partial [Myxococcota bacterium]
MTDYASNVIGATLEQELGESFGRYARATILARAIPDVRDGLKPVHRRIIYAMYLAKNGPDQRYRKCAKTVGEVMGSFHPHGDQSIYDALVRLAQSWKMRAMLVDGHGNFGSIDDDPPAAMRYTEARLASIAVELTRDIEKATVAFQPNFDDSTKEPTVLPARYPNLLVNGTSGVSTGFATEIQPHNLGECIDALLAMIADPDITLAGLMEHIKGPDFPTGGVMPGLDDLHGAYETGKGRVVLRARATIETARDGRAQIVVTEIPYGVNKSNLVRDIEKLRTDKVVQGIKDVRDESDREGLRVVVDMGRGVAAEPILAFLFKKTDLQVYRHFQMVAIVDQSPMQLGLRDILWYYLEHQKEVVTRRSQYDLDRAERRLHLVAGLIRAIDVLDEVIAIIRAASDRADAHEKLMVRFDFSDEQTKEILDLRLHRLTNLQILQLQGEQAELEKEIAKLTRILGSYKVLMSTIKKELLSVRAAFADERRTTILEHVEDISEQIRVTVTVKEQPVVVGISRDGYIKRSTTASFEKSGGDVESAGVKEDDILRWPLHSNTLHHVLILTAQGKAFTLPSHEIPEAKWGDTGTALVNVVAFDKDDSVVTALNIQSFDTDEELCFVTRQGSLKRTLLKDIQSQRTTGVTTMKLSGDDTIVRIIRTDGSGHILIATREGNCIRFPMSEVSVQGRSAGGVRGIRLPTGDRVVDCAVVDEAEDGEVGIITEEGRAKRTPLDLYPAQRRG